MDNLHRFWVIGDRLSWWRHQMETFSASLAICAGNSPVPGEFPAQRPVTRSLCVFFDLRLNKRLSKQSWGWWFETLSRPLWRHSNVLAKWAEIPVEHPQRSVVSMSHYRISPLRPRQNGRHFPDDILKCIFVNEKVWISIKISLKFVLKGPISNIPALVQIMAWRLPGDKPLSEPMMVSLLTHICAIRPQWVRAEDCQCGNYHAWHNTQSTPFTNIHHWSKFEIVPHDFFHIYIHTVRQFFYVALLQNKNEIYINNTYTHT